MIRKPTVLVVGAGASAAFGFPLGFDLVAKIAKTGPGTLPQYAFQPGLVNRFCEALRRSGSQSVDVFLEHRTEFLEVGKVAIAHSLIPFEQERRVFTDENGNPTWLAYLFNRMNAKRDDLKRNRLSILTFNYDRSIDFFLRTAVENRYGCTTAEAAELLSAIPIVHLHGLLGTLSDRAYSHETNPRELVRLAAQGIRVVHEGVDGEPQFTRAKTLLREATRVYFLGFGFHPTNVERLGVADTTSRDTIIYGSAYGMTESEKASASHCVRRPIRFTGPETDALGFLRESEPLDA